MAWQARQCGLHINTLRHINYRGTDTVSYRVHRAVADLYERVGMDLGPDRRIAAWSANKGWASMLAWEDDIDDPRAHPARVDNHGHRAHRKKTP